MIMFYDILLLDDIVCATEPHDKQSHRLRSVVQCIPGRAEISTRVKIRFLSRHAPELLRYEIPSCSVSPHFRVLAGELVLFSGKSLSVLFLSLSFFWW
jgi:hypothetical protein